MVEQKKVGNEILQLRAKYQIYILKIEYENIKSWEIDEFKYIHFYICL